MSLPQETLLLPYYFLKKRIPRKIQEKFEADKLKAWRKILFRLPKNQYNDCWDLAEYIYTTCDLSKPQNIEALQEKDINNVLKQDNPANLLEVLKKLRNNGVPLTIENVKKVIAIKLDSLNGILAIFEEYNFAQPEDVEAILEQNNPAKLLEVLNTLKESLCLTEENFRAVISIHGLDTLNGVFAIFVAYSCLELEYVRAALIEKDPAKLLKVLNTLKESLCLTAENLMAVIRIKDLGTFDETLNILKNYRCLKPEYVNKVLTQSHLAELLKVLNTLKESLCLTAENLMDVICIEDLGTFDKTLNILKNYGCSKPEYVNKVLTQNGFAGLLLRLQGLGFLNTENVEAVVAIPRNSDLFPDKILTLCKKHNYLAEKVTALLKHDDHLGVLQRLEVLEKHGFLNAENIQAAAEISKNNDLDLDKTLPLFQKCNCLAKDVTALLKHGDPVKVSNRLDVLEKHGFLDTKNVQTTIAASKEVDLNLDKLLTLFKKYNCLKIDLIPVLKHDDPVTLFQKLNKLAKIGLLNAANVQALATADDINVAFDAVEQLFKRYSCLEVDLTAVLKSDNTTKLCQKLNTLKEQACLGVTDKTVQDVQAVKPTIAAIIHLMLDLLKKYNCLELENVKSVLNYDDPPGLLEGLQMLATHGLLNNTANNVQRMALAAKPLVKASLLIFTNQGKQKDVEATLKEPDMRRLEKVLSKLYDKSILTPETWTVVFATYPHLENFNAKLNDPNFIGALQELKSAGLLKQVNILAAMNYTRVWKDNDASSNFSTHSPSVYGRLGREFLEENKKRYFPEELNQESLDAYAHKIAKETPSILTDSDYLNIAIKTTQKGTSPNKCPSFENVKLPFAIDEKLFAIMARTQLEERIMSKKNTLAQALNIQKLWHENGNDTAAQEYSNELRQGLLELFKENGFITKPLKQEFITQEEHDFSKGLLPVVIQMGLEKKIAAGKTELAQELFTQAVWLEGRVGKETQKYLTDLSPKLEPVLRAAFKKYKIGTDLLDEKRIVFYGNKGFTPSEETLETATKYYSHEEVPLVAGAEKIVEEVENAINTLSALQPSEARLCEAIRKYAEAANQDPALKNPIKFILWEIKTRLLIDLKTFEDVKELLQESDIAKLLDDNPPSCYLGHTWEEVKNIKEPIENLNNPLVNNSDTEYLAADGSFTNEAEKQHKVAEKQQRKENILLKSKFESLQKDNKTVQAENKSLKENILLLKGEKASLEQRSSLMQEDCKTLQVKNSSLKEKIVSLEEKNTSCNNNIEQLNKNIKSLEIDNNSFQEEIASLEDQPSKEEIYKYNTNKAIEELNNWSKSRDSRVQEYVSSIIDDLKTQRALFIGEKKYDRKSSAAYTNEIEKIAFKSESAKNLATHFGWQGFIVNVVIALTGVGLLLLAGKAIHSKVTRDCVSFFQSNDSLQRVADVGKEFTREAKRNLH